jgi:hypothetical protein
VLIRESRKLTNARRELVGLGTLCQERVRYRSESGKRFPRFVEHPGERGMHAKRFRIDLPERVGHVWKLPMTLPELPMNGAFPRMGVAGIHAWDAWATMRLGKLL